MSNDAKQKGKVGISLSSIFQTIRKPESPEAKRCLSEFQVASSKTVDYTLRRLLGYSKHDNGQWSQRRLIRCLEFIFVHGIKPTLEERLNIPSFRSCVRWIVGILNNPTFHDQMHNDEIALQIQSALKCICVILESIHLKDMAEPSGGLLLIQEIRHHYGVKGLMFWLESSIQPIRLYSVRALTAQADNFAKDMIALNVYSLFPERLKDIPHLLSILNLRVPVTDAAEQGLVFDHCVMLCRLLDSVLKQDCRSSISESARMRLVEPQTFSSLSQVWLVLCKFDHYLMTHRDATTPLKLKNLKFLVYWFTSIIQNCIMISKEKTMPYIETENARLKWRPLMSSTLQQWAYDVCCHEGHPTPNTEQHKLILNKLLQISMNILPSNTNPEYVKQTLLDLTNFLTAFISQPILPEQAVVISTPELIHKNLFVDVEERGYQVSDGILTAHQDLLVIVLECFIQLIQAAEKEFTQSIAAHVAWCLKSFLTILLNHPTLVSLRHRLSKLVIFFLHYPEAIEIFATSTTNISEFVWGPTIEVAKYGLIAASQEPTTHNQIAIVKAKKAFVALEKISQHPRACERLMDCDVLQLMNLPGKPTVLSVYAFFCRFAATLAKRTAFVRTRLRDEYRLFPMIMQLWEVALRDKKAEGAQAVIDSSMVVLRAFMHDKQSMQMWLAWQEPSGERMSVLPLVMKVLFSKPQPQVGAAQLMYDLTLHPLCCRQLVTDPETLSKLSHLVADQRNIEPTEFSYAAYLTRTVVRIFSDNENMQYNILNDAYTSFFRPMLTRPYWLKKICLQIFRNRYSAYLDLFKFTAIGEEAVRLHEYTAVAISYIMLGCYTSNQWNRELGLLEDNVVSKSHVASVLFQMLMFRLEGPGEEEMNLKRRQAAAQAIQVLTLELAWDVKDESDIWMERIILEDMNDKVQFVTDDGQVVSGHRALLQQSSPIFEALLGESFAESNMTAIPLHDVTFGGLSLFIEALNRIHVQKITGYNGILDMSTAWEDIIDLLQISDRFGTPIMKNVCERWVLRKVNNIKQGQEDRLVCLEGMVKLFRVCRDPIEKDGGINSDTWPFSTILLESLNCIVHYMTEACSTKEFLKMINDQEIEEIDAFCSGMAYLLRK